MTMTRPPAVAGAFYPGSPALLSATVDQLLAEAPAAAAHRRYAWCRMRR